METELVCLPDRHGVFLDLGGSGVSGEKPDVGKHTRTHTLSVRPRTKAQVFFAFETSKYPV